MAVRLFAALFPLLLTPLWFYLLAYHIGGDKEIILIFPWTLFALIYLVVFVICWRKHVCLWRSVLIATATACAVIILILLGLAVFTGGL